MAVNKSRIVHGADKVEQDLRQLKILNHRNILDLIDFGEDYWHIYALYEPPPNVMLDKLVAHMHCWQPEEPWVCLVARQTLCALAHSHARGFSVGEVNGHTVRIVLADDILVKPHVLIAECGLRQLTQRNRQEPSQPQSGIILPSQQDVFDLGETLLWLLIGDQAGTEFPSLSWESSPRSLELHPCRLVLQGFSLMVIDLLHSMLDKDSLHCNAAERALQHPWCHKRLAAATDNRRPMTTVRPATCTGRGGLRLLLREAMSQVCLNERLPKGALPEFWVRLILLLS